MAWNRNSLMGQKMVGMMQAESIDPASRVVCRTCGYALALTRLHKLQSTEGFYCRACGAVIGRDGAPLSAGASKHHK